MNPIGPARSARSCLRCSLPGPWDSFLTGQTFDPGNALPLGFKSAIPSQPRLFRKRQGPFFTLIHRDNYTTHSPFFVS